MLWKICMRYSPLPLTSPHKSERQDKDNQYKIKMAYKLDKFFISLLLQVWKTSKQNAWKRLDWTLSSLQSQYWQPFSEKWTNLWTHFKKQNQIIVRLGFPKSRTIFRIIDPPPLSHTTKLRTLVKDLSNIFCLAASAGILHCRNCNKHSNRLVAVSGWPCSFRIHKNTGRHLSA